MTTLQEALSAPGCERIKDFYNTGPAQRAAVESFMAALAQHGESSANIPHTLAGFIGAFESETGHPPTKQEIWNGAIRSFRDLNTAAPAPVAQQRMTDEQIEDLVKQCGGKWNGDVWTFEDADLHPFVRTALQSAQPVAQYTDIVSDGGMDPRNAI